jgi:V/A-type H+-transporting ATPase subunit B
MVAQAAKPAAKGAPPEAPIPVDYRTIDRVAGPLLFVREVERAKYGEIVEIQLPDGTRRQGQVLDSRRGLAIVQVFGPTMGMNVSETSVKFLGDVARLPVSREMLGRVFTGLGEPRDGGPRIVSEEKLEIVGNAMNPYSREEPSEFIQTGISSIDVMNTLVRGQKLPLFSGAGLPHNQIAAQIVRQAKLRDSSEGFAVVFAAMGITSEEANYFLREFENTGALENTVAFLNLSSDPSMERVITPRMALTTAEYLAYEHDMHILVVLTDMTSYCEALREIAAAREEVPGRRGYPGYMYTDLATLYERAGKIQGRKGSITQLPILTMPADDVTHPIPDLTGYITEGQVYVSRELQRRGVYPPIDPLPSLSRLMNQGIGKGRTREDHRGVADQLFASYANGKDLRALSAIVGEEALSATDRIYLQFADRYEKEFLNQRPDEDRTIDESLGLGWSLLSELPESELKRIKPEFIERYNPARTGAKASA